MDAKYLKKQRLGYERIMRARVQELEGALSIGNLDVARHAMAGILSATNNLEVLTKLSTDKAREEN